ADARGGRGGGSRRRGPVRPRPGRAAPHRRRAPVRHLRRQRQRLAAARAGHRAVAAPRSAVDADGGPRDRLRGRVHDPVDLGVGVARPGRVRRGAPGSRQRRGQLRRRTAGGCCRSRARPAL
ncbi:MAG: CrcB protein, partial [uncultured Frankineae bacterium]